MLRLAAVMVVLLGALSVLTSANAYKLARPSNPTTVQVINVNTAAIKIEPGTGDDSVSPFYRWFSTSGAGSINLSNAQDGLDTHSLESGATYSLAKIIKVTNSSGSPKSVSMSLTGSGGTYSNLSWYKGESSTSNTGACSLLDGEYLYVNFSLTPTASGSFTLTVTAGPP